MSSIPQQNDVKSEQLGRIFDEAMSYVAKGEYRSAAMAFLSDTDKIGYDVGIFLMPLLSISDENTNPTDMIKMLSGFSSMPDRVKNYYKNPELALKDYSE